jgi:hypothetical protein
MSVYSATESQLAALGVNPEEDALAATALAVASTIDDPHISATSRSMNAKALVDVMSALRDLLPPEEVQDGITALRQRRDRQRARSADATSLLDSGIPDDGRR